MRAFPRSMVAAAMLLLSVPLAVAADKPEPLIPEFPPESEVCYGREYDAPHLSSHPRQKVSAFYLFRSLTADPLSEEQPRPREALAARNLDWERETRAEGEILPQALPGRSSLDVVVKFRDRSTVYKQSVECRKLKAKGFECGVDCDGGGFTAEAEGRSLMLRQDARSGGLRVQSGCSSGDESAPEVRIDPKDDALAFRLEPKPISACHAVRDAARPAWARGDAKPLRVRFAGSNSLCFVSRAATGKAAERRIARLSIRTLGPLPDATGDEAANVKVELAATLAGGMKVRRTLECRADDFAFQCSVEHGGFRLTRSTGQGVTLRESYHEGGDLARLLGMPETIKFEPLELQAADRAQCEGAGQ